MCVYTVRDDVTCDGRHRTSASLAYMYMSMCVYVIIVYCYYYTRLLYINILFTIVTVVDVVEFFHDFTLPTVYFCGV